VTPLLALVVEELELAIWKVAELLKLTMLGLCKKLRVVFGQIAPKKAFGLMNYHYWANVN
jgi:hypothetical protein